MATNDTALRGPIPGSLPSPSRAMSFRPYAEYVADLDREFEVRTRCSRPRREPAWSPGRSPRACPPTRISSPPTSTSPCSTSPQRDRPAAPRRLGGRPTRSALPFEDAAFDAVVCQFGVMFFPDKVQAHREARRVLRAGRRSSSMSGTASTQTNSKTWSPKRWRRLPRRSAALPGAHAARLPRSGDDPQDLAAAGFGDVAIETVTLPSRAARRAIPRSPSARARRSRRDRSARRLRIAGRDRGGCRGRWPHISARVRSKADQALVIVAVK